MSDDLVIRSHKGEYRVHFEPDVFAVLADRTGVKSHFIVDRRVAELYGDRLKAVLAQPSVLLLDAVEASKSLEKIPAYVEHLMTHEIHRDHQLIAVGGGIIQDITCFLASTLLRGVDWVFVPTTLLAQADSCIGSKSSINCGNAKNIVGTFNPPQEIFINTDFLATLEEKDLRSGMGEILKVHAIDGPQTFDRLAADYPRLFTDGAFMLAVIRRSLLIKQPYVERDEFDRGERNIFNYGHSFGHAMEAATDFAIPHGIAVTLGMDMANFVAGRLGLAPQSHCQRMHPVLAANYRGFEETPVPPRPFHRAIAKDKKNLDGALVLIVPAADGRPHKVRRAADEDFAAACAAYFEEGRRT